MSDAHSSFPAEDGTPSSAFDASSASVQASAHSVRASSGRICFRSSCSATPPSRSIYSRIFSSAAAMAPICRSGAVTRSVTAPASRHSTSARASPLSVSRFATRRASR